jgi:hypothetical protein
MRTTRVSWCWWALGTAAVLLLQTVGGSNPAMCDWTYGTPSIGPIQSSTWAAAPDGTASSRTTVGVDEGVTCSIDPSTWTDWDSYSSPESYPESYWDALGTTAWWVSWGGQWLPWGGGTSIGVQFHGPGQSTVWVYAYAQRSNNAASQSITFNIINPSGEATPPQFQNLRQPYWQANNTMFTNQVLPASVSFANISVQEDDGAGATDGCYWQGAPPDLQPRLGLAIGALGGAPQLDVSNEWVDVLSWSTYYITQYRIWRPALSLPMPCSASLPQLMYAITQAQPRQYYWTDTLVLTIGMGNLTNIRNNCSSTTQY